MTGSPDYFYSSSCDLHKISEVQRHPPALSLITERFNGGVIYSTPLGFLLILSAYFFHTSKRNQIQVEENIQKHHYRRERRKKGYYFSSVMFSLQAYRVDTNNVFLDKDGLSAHSSTHTTKQSAAPNDYYAPNKVLLPVCSSVKLFCTGLSP